MLIKYYIPTQGKGGEPINNKEFTTVIKGFCAVKNGGYTQYNAIGGYLNSSKQLQEEPVIIIESFGEYLLDANIIKDYAKELNQECLAVRIDDRLDLYCPTITEE